MLGALDQRAFLWHVERIVFMGSLFKITEIDGRCGRKGRWLSAVGCRLSVDAAQRFIRH